MRDIVSIAFTRHHQLERACGKLVDVVLRDDPGVFAARWERLEAAIREHIATEERLILPAYQQSDPGEADALRTEHAHLRSLLDEIGEHVRRHGVHTQRLRRLATTLRDHLAHEDTSMYGWVEHHPHLLGWRSLRARIRARRSRHRREHPAPATDSRAPAPRPADPRGS